ncbi:peptidase [Lyngbya confervoides]|uniref:Peptidase n=1 Tax=Lyngbya confervoides BDU141951 TaxID=1574623 RepID=A0ABD4T8Q4_9CYAN|nr:peptidase [Lyngbya confervoides]MCM1984702.1 peptidase [Lyngbya confervoides BDU141951]
MTYCLGIITRAGLVMAADSRTSAGADYVSSAQKLFDLSLPRERVLLICTAGNLSMTQTIMAKIRRDIKDQVPDNLNAMSTLHDISDYIGRQTREVLDQNRHWMNRDNIDYSCSFLVGGQVRGESPELYMIYSQGNFLRATKETPYLQIGEIKYGKPILDRTIEYEETQLDEAAKCALLSLDSTMKSNISVGPPINLALYEADTLKLTRRCQFKEGDSYLIRIRTSWEKSLRRAFQSLPEIDWIELAEDEDDLGNWLSPSNIYTA